MDLLCRLVGYPSVAWRALYPLFVEGAGLLAAGRFDLVYFSTTAFPLFCLGRLWRRRFGVPYVLDFQDPWFRPVRRYATSAGKIKARVVQALSKHLERWTLEHAAGIVSVSPVYLSELAGRYPGMTCVRPDRCAAIPFGASLSDFTAAIQAGGVVRREEGGDTIEIAYVGAGGEIMARSFRRIVQLLAQVRQSDPALVARVRIRLVGTCGNWREGDPLVLQAIARDHGVGDLVEERPPRIGYVDALSVALGADGLLVLGVDDAAYMPSKLFTYALTGRPLLACVHPRSPVNALFAATGSLSHLIHFAEAGSGGGAGDEADDQARVREYLHEAAARYRCDRYTGLAPYLSPAAAARHAALFEACLEPR